jgi:cobalt-zinc-cadmium efflux system outer membrane protein
MIAGLVPICRFLAVPLLIESCLMQMPFANYQQTDKVLMPGMRLRSSVAKAGLSLAIMMLGGCVLAPEGTRDEHARLDEATGQYERPAAERELPPLPRIASWRDVLHQAFLANGELEAAYFDWKAAIIQIDQAAAWPNTRLALGYSYMFSPQNMKAWNRTTLSGGFDPGMNLQLPIKPQTAGKVALDAAREAGEKFLAAKFELQRKVLSAYLDLALAEERLRIQRDEVNLLKLSMDSASARALAGGPLQDMFKAKTEWALAKNNLLNMDAAVRSSKARLNGMLAREAQAPLTIPSTLPPPRPVVQEDGRLIAVAVDRNPELAALARQVEGRKDAIDLAALGYLPDFSPSGAITGNISQAVGTMVMLPTTLPQIRASIDNAGAMARSSEAVLRQTEKDRAASFVANLYLMRNAERQAQFYRRTVIPLVDQTLSSSQQAYAAGQVSFAELIDSIRTYNSIRFMVAEVKVEREKRLVELEALAGVDIETLSQAPISEIKSRNLASSQ